MIKTKLDEMQSLRVQVRRQGRRHDASNKSTESIDGSRRCQEDIDCRAASFRCANTALQF